MILNLVTSFWCIMLAAIRKTMKNTKKFNCSSCILIRHFVVSFVLTLRVIIIILSVTRCVLECVCDSNKLNKHFNLSHVCYVLRHPKIVIYCFFSHFLENIRNMCCYVQKFKGVSRGKKDV